MNGLCGERSECGAEGRACALSTAKGMEEEDCRREGETGKQRAASQRNRGRLPGPGTAARPRGGEQHCSAQALLGLPKNTVLMRDGGEGGVDEEREWECSSMESEGWQ